MPPTRTLPKSFDLKTFMQRKQTLKQYKEFIRLTYRPGILPEDPKTQDTFMRDEIRHNYQKNKNETDEDQIKYFRKYGDSQLEYLYKLMGLTGS